jgi:hypothetical protein
MESYGTINKEKRTETAPFCYFPRRYVMVILCFLCLLIIYLYRVILSVAILPMAEVQFHFKIRLPLSRFVI